ncbi:hypothetical protein, conserved [Leishmania tarentolae]|uniref:Uncharacterized protein n=1 Tax=Leishmania tarentolae TaxID=5689 RepID=A0A640KK08_LEITA|nr:hypothetical protein, conserved [Leishmania tarentolae]
MSQVSQPLHTAGDYLVTTFANMMHTPSFRRHVWAKMQQAARRRLDALRLQALYGDAPVMSAASGGAANAASEATAVGTMGAKSESTAKTSLQEASPTSTASGSVENTAGPASRPLAPLRWFDIAGRARYSAWVALRGRMSADVAAECFCAEFLGLIKKHPCPTLMPLVEAALSTAHGLARRSRATPPQLLVTQLTSTSSEHSTGATTAPSSSSMVLQVRALQGDPAALALLWICRAYRLPCKFMIEPLSKALRTRTTGVSMSASSISGVRCSETADSCATALPSTNPYLSYTMADACYPFTVSLMQPTDAAAGTSPPTVATTVTTPEAAFVLLADTFLAGYPHWMGVPSDSVNAVALSPASLLVKRCAWLDELQHITRHVRTPILALLVHQAVQPQRLRRLSSISAAAERRHLLRAVAAHLHTYERWTMDRVLSRRVHQSQSLLSPLLASTAVVDCLRHAYAPDTKVVSAADAYVSSCGYVLCTHPFCADVFPFLRVPPVPVAALHDTVQEHWPTPERPQREAPSRLPNGSVTASYVSWALPLHLSGIPAEYNSTINRILRREANGAIRQEQHQQPVRLFIDDESEAKLSHSRSIGGGRGGGGGPSKRAHVLTTDTPQQQQQHCRAGYYAISESSITKEAAEAVEQLILARMLSLRTDDLNSDSGAAASTSSVSGVPFLVLGHVFALTWALCQEQVPGFPYFMLDGNPHHHGGFSFLPESNAKKTSTSGSASARGKFQASLSPAPTTAIIATADTGASMLPVIAGCASAASSASSQDGGISLESRIRYGWQAVTDALAMGAARLSGVGRPEVQQRGTGEGSKENTSANATQVVRSEENFIGAAPSTTASAVVATSRL